MVFFRGSFANDDSSAAICLWARRIVYSIAQFIAIAAVVVVVCTANGFIG